MNIKKAALLCMIMLMVGTVSACGNNSDNNRENNTDVNSEAGTDNNAENSVDNKAESYVYISAINAADYVTLGEYKGIELTEEAVSIPDEYVDRYIDEYILASQAVKTEVKDRTDVREGDIANIDYKGYKDGVAFAGGTAEGYDLVIGSGSFIPGFEDGLIGAEVGETVSLDLTFPENYTNADLAGADVVFEVTINSISVTETPELTDELVTELAIENCATVEELKSYLYDAFYSTAMQNYNQTVNNDVVEAAMENCTFEELPDEIVDRYYDELIDGATSTAESYGTDLSTYIQNYYGMEEADYKERLKENAQTIAQRYVMFYAIADVEGIDFTDEEKEEIMKELASSYGLESVDELKEEIDEETMNEYILAEKVVEFLVDNAIINTNEVE
ncbi:MAG: trigger factor [Lachnospiraceae bacterium]|nr:trigger factor [Lachnospiraceae bacterium]